MKLYQDKSYCFIALFVLLYDYQFSECIFPLEQTDSTLLKLKYINAVVSILRKTCLFISNQEQKEEVYS